jgi:hypothetical protein
MGSGIGVVGPGGGSSSRFGRRLGLRRRAGVIVWAKKDKTPTWIDKTLFSAAELLGMVLSDARDEGEADPQPMGVLRSRVSDAVKAENDTIRRISNLFDCSYFFCGEGNDADWEVFADDCLFSDEFSSFVGTERFRRNVNNFGKVLRKGDDERRCILTKLEQRKDERTPGRTVLVASWVFRSRVILVSGLLAASGKTEYVVRDSDGKVIEHNERWNTSKADVFKRLLFG